MTEDGGNASTKETHEKEEGMERGSRAELQFNGLKRKELDTGNSMRQLCSQFGHRSVKKKGK